MKLKAALAQATALLNTSSQSPRIDAEILLCHLLNCNQAFLYTHPDKALNETEITTYQSLITTRMAGTPIAYLTGKREFWSLPLQVSEDTLIPRPETERLVEKALELTSVEPIRALDLGTGSGAIALAIAHARPHWQLTACDKSLKALQIAMNNAKRLNINNVTFIHSDWFEELGTSTFDVIVSNPPYIAAEDPHLSLGDLRFEPQEALVSGTNGLESLHFIIKHSYNHLSPHGILLVEHGYDQRVAVDALFKKYGYANIQCYQDWQGHDRVTSGER